VGCRVSQQGSLLFDVVFTWYPLAAHRVHWADWCCTSFFRVPHSFTSLGHNNLVFVSLFLNSQPNACILYQEKVNDKPSALFIATISDLPGHTSWAIWFKNPIIFFGIYSLLLYQVYDGNKSFLLQPILLAEHLMLNNAKYVMPHFTLTFSQLAISTYCTIYSLRA